MAVKVYNVVNNNPSVTNARKLSFAPGETQKINLNDAEVNGLRNAGFTVTETTGSSSIYLSTTTKDEQDKEASTSQVIGTAFTGAGPHALALAHKNQTVVVTHTADAVLNLPNNLPVGFQAKFIQGGAGDIVFTPLAGATLRNRQTHARTAGQYAKVEVTVISNANGVTAEYVLFGDTSAT